MTVRQMPPLEPTPEELDAAADQMQRQIKFNEDVARRLRDLRIADAARAQLRAEQVTESNFDAQFLDRAALLNLQAPDPLIERVLPRHSYVILRGRDHSFKSFVAIDWACCLATGKPWQGHAVEPTRVLYIAGEGAHGLASRLDAWEYAWGHHVPPEMFTVRTTAPNMHQPGPAFDHLLDHVTDGDYGLVIVDTLRRVSGSADGNGSEMGQVVDNLDRIKRATTNGTVLTVAHTDKGDHDTRGYSGIEDDADVVWAAKREEMYLTLQLTKMKDGPDGRSILLEAHTTLGSLVLSDTSGPGAPDTTESQTRILEALRIMPDGGVTGPNLMGTAELGKASFYRGLKELRERGLVSLHKKGSTTYYELPALDLDPPTDAADTAIDDAQMTLTEEDE